MAKFIQELLILNPWDWFWDQPKVRAPFHPFRFRAPVRSESNDQTQSRLRIDDCETQKIQFDVRQCNYEAPETFQLQGHINQIARSNNYKASDYESEHIRSTKCETELTARHRNFEAFIPITRLSSLRRYYSNLQNNWLQLRDLRSDGLCSDCLHSFAPTAFAIPIKGQLIQIVMHQIRN